MSEISPVPHDHHKSFPSTVRQLSEAMRFEPVAQVFKQLSDACRYRIFLLLCHSEECVINIATAVKMSSLAVAHHLRLLRLAGLVTIRREGKEVFYRVADTELARSMHRMIEEVLHLSCTNQER